MRMVGPAELMACRGRRQRGFGSPVLPQSPPGWCPQAEMGSESRSSGAATPPAPGQPPAGWESTAMLLASGAGRT